jgi:hypothetical protein
MAVPTLGILQYADNAPQVCFGERLERKIRLRLVSARLMAAGILGGRPDENHRAVFYAAARRPVAPC